MASTMRFFNGPGLLVIDELGYLPLSGEAASALFQLISQRYLKTSIVLSSNRGVGSWGEIVGGTAVAAVLLHRSVVLTLDGDSYRLRGLPRPQQRRPHLASPRRVRAGGRCQGRCAAE